MLSGVPNRQMTHSTVMHQLTTLLPNTDGMVKIE